MPFSKVVDTMLRNEHQQLVRRVSLLRQECQQRPKGSLSAKKRGNASYVYLVKRVEGKVVTEYLGKEGSWKVKGVEAKIRERRRYENELKDAESQLFRLEKMIRAGNFFLLNQTKK
ncbi:MAG: hypothetical protein GXY71_04985 [Treponema sp.]|jgi:hypothetical protein|nr:hypothetical protein [Treponema sp.]HOI21918.1 hypothetical protein [Spirochaetales bacterium]